MNISIKGDRLEVLAKKFLLSADVNRLKILCKIFCDKKCCVSDIAKDLNLSIAIVSHHLKTMAKFELLTSKRNGKMICYSLANNPFANDLKKMISKYK